jgi:hypothetical protein
LPIAVCLHDDTSLAYDMLPVSIQFVQQEPIYLGMHPWPNILSSQEPREASHLDRLDPAIARDSWTRGSWYS